MTGQRLLHYQVLDKLGEGGMGVVYKARDTHLDRFVAIKVLPPEKVSDPDRKARFIREAKAASALNHPNIITIHDIASDNGTDFIAMEYVAGRTLDQLIPRKGMRLNEALKIAIRIADALARAHTAGIIHRDLKPANIMVDSHGQVKVLDFGLAKLTEGASAEAVTVTAWELTVQGAAVGTVAYMSPEQARGEALDARSDLFSFGVVLYLMATGQQPFHGNTPYQTVDAILHTEPAPPLMLNPECPAGLDRIIQKALEKDLRLRYRSASEVSADLVDLQTAIGTTGPRGTEDASIVVLPFENLSPDPENSFFADGMTEELIAELAAVRALRVISRTTAMQYRGARKSLPAIAGELHVRYVLEGSVRRAGSIVRITAQLIEAATDTHLWAERYTGVLDDVFDLQERLARSIVQALRVALTPDEDHRLARRQIQDARAFDLYLRSRQAMHELTQTGLERASALLSEALAITGPNALLFGAQGEVCFWFRDMCIRPDPLILEEAAAHIDEALSLDPDCSSALLVRCMIAWRQGDMRRAILDARRAAELGGGGDALTMLTFACGEAGLMAEALRAAGDAVSVDPGNWFCRFAQGLAALLDGNLRAAEEAFRRVVEMTGGIPVSHLWHGIVLAYSGRANEASSSFAQAQRARESMIAGMGRLHDAALRGDPEEFAAIMAGGPLAELARADKEFSWWLADLHARMGGHETALCWLEQSVQLGFYNQRFWSEVDPFLSPLRGYPRFEELMHLARLRQYALRLD